MNFEASMQRKEKREQAGTDISMASSMILNLRENRPNTITPEVFCNRSQVLNRNGEGEPEQTWNRSRTVLGGRKSRPDALGCCCHIGVEIEIKILILDKKEKRNRARADMR
jgi:hypothetical protein